MSSRKSQRTGRGSPSRERASSPGGFRWFFPSFHGDLRLETEGDGTVLKIVKPTPREVEIVNAIGAEAQAKKWLDDWTPFVASGDDMVTFTLRAPVDEVGAVVIKHKAPGLDTLTAMKLRDGGWDITAATPPEEPGEAPKPAPPPETKDAVAGATVKRPTPSCPQCEPGSVEPASEVLLSFLDTDQHEQWARERTITVEGGISGNRYLLAHRHSHAAARIGRVCWDLDDRQVIHFHDYTVPPEEEILAAMLILRHREPWLRNEATAWGGRNTFKNPFGDSSDGVFDSVVMTRIGRLFGVN